MYLLSAIMLVALAVGLDAQDAMPCTRLGPMCKDCGTRVNCVSDGGTGFTEEQLEDCVVGFVCDEWSLQCERRGICRYKELTCQSDTNCEEVIFPNPYSCIGYYGCKNTEINFYQCKPGEAYDFKKNACSPMVNNKCDDYPALCENAGQTGTIGESGFQYVCKEEAGPPHVIYPEIIGSGGTNPPTTPTNPTTPYPCEREGYFEDPLICTKFYVCYWIGNGYGSKHMSCRKGSYFDPGASRCVAGSCQATTTVSNPTSPCSSEGYFEIKGDRKCFLVCYSIGGNRFGNEKKCCRRGSHFDTRARRCVKGN